MVMVMHHVNDPVPPAVEANPEVDPALSDWIDRLLVKACEERTQSVAEAWESLEEIVERLLGPRWRRQARIDEPERTLDTPRPLTPAPFETNPVALVSDHHHHLYLIGGATSDPTSPSAVWPSQDAVWRLDSVNGSWQLDQKAKLPEPRSAGAAAWDGNRIVFAGGEDNGEVKQDVWALSDGAWTRIGHLQRAREQLTAASDPTHGTVWFVGGAPAKGSKPGGSTDLPFVDVATSRGVIPGEDIVAVQRSAAVGVDSGFCIIGGRAGGRFVRQAQCQQAQPPIPPFEQPRANLGAAVLNGTVYVVGGWAEGQYRGTRTVAALNVTGAR